MMRGELGEREGKRQGCARIAWLVRCGSSLGGELAGVGSTQFPIEDHQKVESGSPIS